MEGMDNDSGHEAENDNGNKRTIRLFLKDDDDDGNTYIEKIVIGVKSGDNFNVETVLMDTDNNDSEADDITNTNRNSNFQDEE
ncbi:Hypothetical protein CINCED_3A022249, partial [Cinara cedri]